MNSSKAAGCFPQVHVPPKQATAGAIGSIFLALACGAALPAQAEETSTASETEEPTLDCTTETVSGDTTKTTCSLAGELKVDGAVSIKGADATDALTITTGAGELDRGLVINVTPGALSGMDVVTSAVDVLKPDSRGNFMRFIGADGRPFTQIGDGGQIETVAWMVISGQIRDVGANRYFVHPTNRPFMLGVYSDVLGPTAVFRSNYFSSNGDSWPLSLISGQGQEILRFTDAGDILMGSIAADPFVAEEQLQLRLTRVGDVGFQVKSNALESSGPAYFQTELNGFYGGTASNGDVRALLRYADGAVVAVGTGQDTIVLDAGANAVRLESVLQLKSLTPAGMELPAPAGSLAYCADCSGSQLRMSDGTSWQSIGADPTEVQAARDQAADAQSTAAGALATADAAQAAASAALTKADGAASKADAALAHADSALYKADAALERAGAAEATAQTALIRADFAAETADNALARADAAQATATTALTTADAAQAIAEVALGAIDDMGLRGDGGLRLGRGATTDGGIAIGSQAAVAQGGSAAIGHDARAAGNGALALGQSSAAAGAKSIAIGDVARASDEGAISIGEGAKSGNGRSVAVGSAATAEGGNSLALGNDATASGYTATATGTASQAYGKRSLAAGYFATAYQQGDVALGATSAAMGGHSTAVGTGAVAHEAGTALGANAKVAQGAANGLAIGRNSLVADNASRAVAVGNAASARFADAVSLGNAATANGSGAVAVGNGAQTGSGAGVALGQHAQATGGNASALGPDSQASGYAAAAVGSFARASGEKSVAQGYGAAAYDTGSIAIGNEAVATHGQATAIGHEALARAGSVALGAQAKAEFANSTAVGTGAVTTAANQVMLGGAGSAVVIADITASTAAQNDQVKAVTIDSKGVLGTTTMATAASVQNVRVAMDHIAAVSDQQFALLAGRVSTLEGQVSNLFDLTSTIDQDAQRGIAAVAAAAHPHFPSQPGKTSYASNVAVYRGEVGFSAGLMHRFAADVAITAGVSYAGRNSAAVRAGVAGEF
jgi:hypothetical protein